MVFTPGHEGLSRCLHVHAGGREFAAAIADDQAALRRVQVGLVGVVVASPCLVHACTRVADALQEPPDLVQRPRSFSRRLGPVKVGDLIEIFIVRTVDGHSFLPFLLENVLVETSPRTVSGGGLVCFYESFFLKTREASTPSKELHEANNGARTRHT